MTRFITLAIALLALACIASPAQAATRPANCGAKWIESSDSGQIKWRVTTWQNAPDVHKNITCRWAWRGARKILAARVRADFPQRAGIWMWKSANPHGRHWWVQYYGGHGLNLRLRYLDARGYN